MGRRFLYENFEDWYIPVTESGCWLWLGPVQGDGPGKGHGRFIPNRDQRKVLAHRWSYALRNGEIPKGMLVLHRCDVPSCVNPNHLFLGTHADNNRDRSTKHRSAVGERGGKAKLSTEAVIEIRSTPRRYRVVQELAKKFNVSPHTILDLRHKRRNWQHIQ